MTHDLVTILRNGPCVDSIDTYEMIQQAADRIEELEKVLLDTTQELEKLQSLNAKS